MKLGHQPYRPDWKNGLNYAKPRPAAWLDADGRNCPAAARPCGASPCAVCMAARVVDQRVTGTAPTVLADTLPDL
jgi:hypothetical protein